MTSIRKRNEQIVGMRKQGVSRADIARQFGLSLSRIGFIEQEFQAERTLNEKRARIHDEIRKADELDKSWPTVDLIDALGLSALFRMRLLNHFQKIGKNEMSLRELMSLTAPQKDDLGISSPPVFRIYGVYKKGLCALVLGINQLPLGLTCRNEWQRLSSGP